MTAHATAQTPYRTNAVLRPLGRLPLSRRVRIGVASVIGLTFLVAVAFAMSRMHVASRNEIGSANSRLEAKKLQEKAVAWRSTHTLSCPTLADIGESPMQVDAWNTGYTIECTATTTTVFSAGPDRTYFTADDPRYPK